MSTEVTYPLSTGVGSSDGKLQKLPARRRWIDEVTGDYELVRGRPRNDDTARSKVVLALRMRRGSCPVAPRLGSRLHELRKLTPDAPRLAAAYGREALKHLTDAGEIRELVITGEATGTHTKGLHLRVSYRDRAGQRQSISYTHRMS